MDIFTATETAYKNGYKKGLQDTIPTATWEFSIPDQNGNKKPNCSNCGEYHLTTWSDWRNCKFCPECGAKILK